MFVMPEEYRHGATGKKMAVPAPAARPVTTPPVVVPKPPVAGVPKKKRMSKGMRVMLVVGAILLIGLAVAAVVVVQGTKKEPAKTAEVPVVTPAKPTPTPPVTKPVETPKPAESPFPAAVVPGKDTDSDGLTDLEETLLYGTNARLPDTDSDGFLDGNEVYHRYNPAGTSPGTLYDAGLVRAYQGPTLSGATVPGALYYSLLYPSVWTVKGSEKATIDSPVTVVATTGESVSISLSAFGMPEGTSPSAWYKAQGLTGTVALTTTKNGSSMLVSEDQLSCYIFSKGYVMTMKMNTSSKSTVDYLQTFKMMLNSVTWL